MIPKIFLDHNFYDMDNPLYDEKYIGQNSPKTFTEALPKPTNLDGYTPKNNKLFTYPYCYLIYSNNNGSNNILHYEKFSINGCEFR
jgi:hypothetical protein